MSIRNCQLNEINLNFSSILVKSLFFPLINAHQCPSNMPYHPSVQSPTCATSNPVPTHRLSHQNTLTGAYTTPLILTHSSNAYKKTSFFKSHWGTAPWTSGGVTASWCTSCLTENCYIVFHYTLSLLQKRVFSNFKQVQGTHQAYSADRLQ